MRAFRCEVIISIIKAGVVSHSQPVVWVVRADNEEAAERKIYRHFREYGMIGNCKKIYSISFNEIILHRDMDLEEYLEVIEDATICVLF